MRLLEGSRGEESAQAGRARSLGRSVRTAGRGASGGEGSLGSSPTGHSANLRGVGPARPGLAMGRARRAICRIRPHTPINKAVRSRWSAC
jgi:hypothetical protein